MTSNNIRYATILIVFVGASFMLGSFLRGHPLGGRGGQKEQELSYIIDLSRTLLGSLSTNVHLRSYDTVLVFNHFCASCVSREDIVFLRDFKDDDRIDNSVVIVLGSFTNNDIEMFKQQMPFPEDLSIVNIPHDIDMVFDWFLLCPHDNTLEYHLQTYIIN